MDDNYSLLCLPGSEVPTQPQLERIADYVRRTDNLGAFRVDGNTVTLFLADQLYTSVLPAGKTTPEILTANLLPEWDALLALLK